jgi:hypothetical protein
MRNLICFDALGILISSVLMFGLGVMFKYAPLLFL